MARVSVVGEISVPGDKSISHRAIMLGAIATGKIVVSNLLFSEDVLATVAAMRALSVVIELDEENKTAIVHGVGLHGLKKSNYPIDCGNSGTTMRLLAGLLAAQPFDTELVGDASLMKRPMARIADPLRLMGANIDLSRSNTAPIKITGNQKLIGITYSPLVASAQVKSAILLAGLYADGETKVNEKIKTRDHTERMLTLLYQENNSIEVPGDISSAAFFIVLAAITPGSNLLIKNVGVNPYRSGVITILEKMGADITLRNQRQVGLESVADIVVRYAPLRGIDIPQETIASAIDEFPAIFIAAALAAGKTTLRGAKELRVKESDRIAVMAEGLMTLGVPAVVFDDGLAVSGVDQFTAGTVRSYGDHRVAMAFKIAALRSGAAINVDGVNCINTSFPEFFALYERFIAD